jgi:oligopeptide transport system substrate-binding protein
MRWIWILLVLISCSKKPTPNSAFRISFNNHPTTLNPQEVGDFASSTLICMLYEGLTRCGAEGSIELGLAEKMDLSENQRTYTFTLKEAYWSDGSPITAYDFEKSWKAAFRPVGPNAYLFYPIKNAEGCAKGSATVEQLGIRALSERVFQVELEQPTPYFYSLTAFPSFLVYKEAGIFSGPFCIEKIRQNDEIVLTKNGQFWNRDRIGMEKIHIQILPDEMTALQLFEKGELDWLGGSFSPLPLDAMEKLKEQLTFIPSAATTFCTFNTERKPFDNLHLRRAFSYAINRGEIVEKILQGGQIPAESLLPPSLSRQPQQLTHIEKAKAELTEAQKELGEIGTIVFYFKGTEVERRLAQTLQHQWQQTLGIRVELVQLDFKTHAQKLQDRDYQISLASWIAQFNDPISILERFKDRHHLKNYPGWENPKFTQLLTDAVTSEQRLDLYTQAEALLAEQVPISPIYHWSVPALCNPRVGHIITTPCGGILFDRVQISSLKS